MKLNVKKEIVTMRMRCVKDDDFFYAEGTAISGILQQLLSFYAAAYQVHQIGEGDPQGQQAVCQLRLRREGPCARVVQKTAQGRLWEGRENEESEFLRRGHFRSTPFCGRVFARKLSIYDERHIVAAAERYPV